REVWAENAAPDPELVDITITRLRRKLDAAGAPGLINRARGEGYILR
ncbi:MAG: DNA-binding response regulator, partial [SAR202 cluster bacterium]|nr:DNA-binding response regulator [SAR202 cluster bacterium]